LSNQTHQRVEIVTAIQRFGIQAGSRLVIDHLKNRRESRGLQFGVQPVQFVPVQELALRIQRFDKGSPFGPLREPAVGHLAKRALVGAWRKDLVCGIGHAVEKAAVGVVHKKQLQAWHTCDHPGSGRKYLGFLVQDQKTVFLCGKWLRALA
jgi:hypothetical protein